MMRAVPFIHAIVSPDTKARRPAAGTRLRVARRLQSIAIGSVIPLAVLGVWSLAVAWHLMRSQILPSPVTVWQTGIDLLRGGDLFAALAVSLQRVVFGLLIGGTLGFILGVAMGRSRTIDAYLGPTVRTICQIPTIAWLPVFMLFFGIGEELKLAIIAKAAFLPLLLNSFAGMRTAPARFHEVADVLELSAWQRLRLVTIPSALPLLAAGFRLALSNAWHVLIVVEMLASAAGIGHMMAWSRTLFQLDVVFVTIAVIGATGWLMDAGMRWAERRLMPWSLPA
jgi:sulfonate transport system permease protein